VSGTDSLNALKSLTLRVSTEGKGGLRSTSSTLETGCWETEDIIVVGVGSRRSSSAEAGSALDPNIITSMVEHTRATAAMASLLPTSPLLWHPPTGGSLPELEASLFSLGAEEPLANAGSLDPLGAGVMVAI